MSRITACRSCAGASLRTVLDLGTTPLANSLLSEERLNASEFRAPLVVSFCDSCSLVQILDTIDPAELFTDYAYFSSFSDTMLNHSKSIATRLTRERGLGEDSLVIEIASNDGYLLQYYKADGIPVLGIEPARNIAKVAIERGIPTLCEFFGKQLGLELAQTNKQADVIHANNVFAHVPDINGFLSGIKSALKSNGVAVIEFPYVGDMIENVEFDTIYHEHVFYFSLTAVQNACSRHGLNIVDVERSPIHGGSLRVFLSHETQQSESVRALLQEEASRGLNRFDAYRHFSEKVCGVRDDLVALLAKLKSGGYRIAAYGASAKGSTLLNFAGIGNETLEFVADRSTVKQGSFTPGTHLPIVAPEALLERNPDYVLLLVWNFAEEVIQQQAKYLERGGKFIVPIPTPTILDGATKELAPHPVPTSTSR